jgi:hypothetical protein
MDQVHAEGMVPTTASPPDPGTASPGEAVDWGAWETYYREASRRRRANGGQRHLREAKRRRRMRERVGIGISAVIVAAMTLVFYLVLTR